MRLQNIDVKEIENIENFEKKPFVIVYSQGVAKLTYLPNHGETKVITHQVRVKRVIFDEGEEF